MSIPKIRLRFAKNLREVRLKAKLTQEELAEQIDVSTRYYQMLESKNPPAVKIDTIGKLAQSLAIRPTKLLEP